MIAWDHNLPPVGKLSQPVVEVENGSGSSAEHREIPCMYKQVAWWNIDLPMQFMGVRDCHDDEVIRVLPLGILLSSQIHTVRLNRC